MTEPLIHQRCWNHPTREAAVRCLECSRFYCRECVVEHRGRMMCATCVSAAIPQNAPARSKNILWTAAAATGILLAWMIFYYLGAMLARIPADFFDKPA